MTLIINGKTYESGELIAYVVHLEKEYAELKKTYRKQRNKRIDELQKKNNGLSADLIKAKEIIVTFLGLIQTFGYSPSMDKFITEAEQFVNSGVKDEAKQL